MIEDPVPYEDLYRGSHNSMNDALCQVYENWCPNPRHDPTSSYMSKAHLEHAVLAT